MPDDAVTVGCLFAAMGGFAEAFGQAGATVLWANEKDHLKPIEDLTVAGDGLARVDVVTAGFPCQPFSAAGHKKGFDDARGLVFLHLPW